MPAGMAIQGLAALVYLAAAIGFQRDLFTGSSETWTRWRTLLWSGLGLHTMGLVLQTAALGHLPIAGLAEAAGTMAWALILLYLLVAPRWNVEVVGTVASPAAFALTAFSLVALLTGSGLERAPGALTAVHVLTVVLGYGAFTLAAICAGLYLVQARLLKRKKLTGLFRRLPPLVTLDRVAYRLILMGFLPMVVGIVTGMLIQHYSHQVYWSWEPKQTMVALTGFMYVLYLHARLLAGWQGRRVNIMLLVAFVLVLVSYLAPGDFHRF